MKKTFTANIAGTVFHVEEDAYEALKRYLENIRANFSGSAGANEIMNDVEARIAELFTERLQGRNVVSLADVEYVRSIMGQPEDFAGDASSKGSEEHANTSAPTGRAHRRLYRDADDKWVGGVLGGLAAYIGTEALWLRIAFILISWPAHGTPVMLYLLLWLLIPRATTSAEKLEMRGEPVTVDNIKRVFEEGAEKFKAGGDRVAQEAEELGRQWGPKARQFGQEAQGAARHVGQSAASILGRLIGVLLILLGASLLLGLVTAVAGGTWSLWNLSWSTSDIGLWEFGGLVFNTSAHAAWFGVGVFVLLLIPIIGLLLAGFRLGLDTRAPRWLNITLSVLWFAALFPTLLTGLDLASDFRRHDRIRTEVTMAQPPADVIYLDALTSDSSVRSWSMEFEDGRMDFDLDGLHVDDTEISGAWGDCDVKQSADSLYHLIVLREARSRNGKAASARAERIGYTYRQSGDVLQLSPWLRFPRADKLRAQYICFTLEVPVGKSVFFRPGSSSILHDIDNVTNTYDGDMVGHKWTMTQKGLAPAAGEHIRGAEEHKEGWADPAPVDTAPKPPPVVLNPPAAQLPSLVGLLHGLVRI